LTRIIALNVVAYLVSRLRKVYVLSTLLGILVYVHTNVVFSLPKYNYVPIVLHFSAPSFKILNLNTDADVNAYLALSCVVNYLKVQ